MQVTVFKNNGRNSEPYSSEKLRKTILAACLNIRVPQHSAESAADMVCKDVDNWLKNKQEITTVDIKEKASEFLKKYHSEAAYIYERHGITI